MKIQVVKDILSANERIAIENQRLLDAKGVFAVNLMASPGAGKTSLILRTIEVLRGKLRVGVIEGDIASQIDADKIEAVGVPVVQLNTGGTCHLDANMVRRGLEALPLDEVELLLIENVGNLICPIDFALGERMKAMVVSTPEGDDKPYKYPGMFAVVEALVINKIDLLPYLDFEVATFRQLVAGLNPEAHIFEVSCLTKEGVEGWGEWLSGVISKWKAMYNQDCRAEQEYLETRDG